MQCSLYGLLNNLFIASMFSRYANFRLFINVSTNHFYGCAFIFCSNASVFTFPFCGTVGCRTHQGLISIVRIWLLIQFHLVLRLVHPSCWRGWKKLKKLMVSMLLNKSQSRWTPHLTWLTWINWKDLFSIGHGYFSTKVITTQRNLNLNSLIWSILLFFPFCLSGCECVFAAAKHKTSLHLNLNLRYACCK